MRGGREEGMVMGGVMGGEGVYVFEGVRVCLVIGERGDLFPGSW